MSFPPHLRSRLILLLLLPLSLLGQNDAPPPGTDDEAQQQLIEDIAANAEEESDEFDFNAAFSLLEAYQERPFDLNKITREELEETWLLTPIQISQILEYRERMNGFVSVFELQVIPSMDLESIRRLARYTRVGGGLDDNKISLKRMFAEGDRELYLRAQRRLESRVGYERGPTDSLSYYLGGPERLYVRFRQKFSNRMSFGLTAEKDPGEAFFAENNKKRGFDFYSAHFYLRNINRRVKAVALGDYNISFGQGLMLYTGFGFGKSSQTTNIARGGQTLRPYTSVNEFSFLRGAATTLGFGKKAELTLFASRKGRTANLITASDTLDLDPEELGVTSLNISGFNRTPNEVEDRNAVTQTTYGASLRYRASQRFQFGINFLSENLSRPLDLRDQPYNVNFFQGTNLLNAGFDYRYRLKNFTFFGEIAGSDNGGIAQLHGLMLGLDRYVDISILYRNYGADYQSLNARPFGETASGRNEEGLYFGLELRPGAHWRVNAYYDVFRFPYLRFNVDAPDQGHEYRFRLTYWQKRKLETYVELRSETKSVGFNTGEAFDEVVPRTRFQGRLHFGYKINAFLDWRSRIDAGFTKDGEDGTQTGMMIYQDLHYRPRGPWSFSARFALFDTEDYDVRFYQYENGLLYNARVVPYYGQGTRTFLVVRYKGIRRLTLEARIAQTFYTDGRAVGSGLEATGGPRATDVGGQVVWRF